MKQMTERSEKAWRNFHINVEAKGGVVLEKSWLGVSKPHSVRCGAGHEVKVRPNSVVRQGICRICAGQDSATAEVAFRARLAELGATLLEDTWLGSHNPHRVICAGGHECTPRPHNMKRHGLCRVCAGLDSTAAEAAFRARLAELGATLLEDTWLGSRNPHRVRCAAGHECTPRPNNVQQGCGICRICAGLDSTAAEAAFRARLAELGATLLEDTWLGRGKPHLVRCAAGHECTPRPSNVQQGGGVCLICAHTGEAWNVLYVVVGPDGVKFGITSGDPRPRLSVHKRDGYGTVVRLHTNLPGTVAPDLERELLRALTEAGYTPVRGREYFAADALPLVLSLVDERL